MSEVTFRRIIWFGLGVAFSNWLFILLWIDPGQASLLQITQFYLTLAASLFGIFFLVGNAIRNRRARPGLVTDRLGASLRQAALFTSLVLFWAVLQRVGLVRWWNIVLLVFVIATIELFFSSRGPTNYAEESPFET